MKRKCMRVCVCFAIALCLMMNIIPIKANTFRTAIKVNLNDKYKLYEEDNYIKIKVKKKGIYKINVRTDCFNMRTFIYKKNGKAAKVTMVSKKENQGYVTKNGNFLFYCDSDVTGYCNVSVFLKLKKGTYIIRYSPIMGYYDKTSTVKITTKFKKSKKHM